MRRYGDINEVQSNSTRYKESIYYPNIETTEYDKYIITKSGDRLDNLAFEYYHDQTLWFVLAHVNNLGKGTLVVPVGIRLRIPDPRIIYNIGTMIKEMQV